MSWRRRKDGKHGEEEGKGTRRGRKEEEMVRKEEKRGNKERLQGEEDRRKRRKDKKESKGNKGEHGEDRGKEIRRSKAGDVNHFIQTPKKKSADTSAADVQRFMPWWALPGRPTAGSRSATSPSWRPCGRSDERAAPVSPDESAPSSEPAPARAPPSPDAPMPKTNMKISRIFFQMCLQTLIGGFSDDITLLMSEMSFPSRGV